MTDCSCADVLGPVPLTFLPMAQLCLYVSHLEAPLFFLPPLTTCAPSLSLSIDTYVLDVWTSARGDGYIHGGQVHLHLHQPAAAASDLRLHVGFRLMPINFNPALFHTGQKANTTVELVVGGLWGDGAGVCRGARDAAGFELQTL